MRNSLHFLLLLLSLSLLVGCPADDPDDDDSAADDDDATADDDDATADDDDATADDDDATADDDDATADDDDSAADDDDDSAGEGELVTGETGTLAGDDVTTWAFLGPDGTVEKVGLSLGATGVQGAADLVNIQLALPAEVVDTTFFDHVQIDFAPGGHDPGPYLVPHFDIHFYGVTSDSLGTVNCDDEPVPAADRLPAPYIIPSTAAAPEGTCIPGMGVHALDPTSPELDPETPEPFEQHFILGYHEGEMTFLEPMLAQAWLLSDPEAGGAVPRPDVLGRSTLYPGQWSLIATDDSFEITFYDFTAIE